MISRWRNKLFKTESEFSKKWMARVTIAIILIFLFIVPLIFVLLFLHLKFGLSYRMCNVFISQYVSLLKISVSAYFVTFIGYMGKAYLGKKEEMKNQSSITCDTDEEDEDDDEEIEEAEDEDEGENTEGEV